jgi:soluble lytic murein transglycosylase-like protein
MGAPAATVSSAQIPQLIANAAAQYGVPSQLALEVAIQESGLNQSAVSSAGAIGVFQLMPATAAGLGVDPTNLQQNIQGGVQYLSQLYSQFGSWDQALAAYNWGPGNVSNAVATYGDPGFLANAPAETQNYVSSIMSAAGLSYSTSITADSLTSGITDTLTNALDSVSDSVGADPTTLLYLTGGALALYLVLDFLTD